MFYHIGPHKFSQNLGGRLVLRPADLQELLTQIALNAYAKTSIFHGNRVYTMDTQ